jgi:hypothetical protein
VAGSTPRQTWFIFRKFKSDHGTRETVFLRRLERRAEAQAARRIADREDVPE